MTMQPPENMHRLMRWIEENNKIKMTNNKIKGRPLWHLSTIRNLKLRAFNRGLEERLRGKTH